MVFKGYKLKVRCIDWEQEEYLGDFWNYISKYISKNKIVGLGMNWTKDNLYFEYALGVIGNDEVLKKLKQIDFSNTKFNVEYVEIKLPNEWDIFKGKLTELKTIYEKIDNCSRKYDYELEYIDDLDNLEIKIHFVN